MAPQRPPSGHTGDESPRAATQPGSEHGSTRGYRGDPWHAFGYLVSGVAVYGAIGWALDRWWGTSFLVVVGILVGAGLGLYLTWMRFNAPRDSEHSDLTHSGGRAAPL